MPLVFINYRVQEQPAYATLLDRVLGERFGRDEVFLASRSLRAGDRFEEVVFDNLRRSAVVLAVIGPRWVSWAGTNGTRRLDAPDDWVQRELVEAFRLGLRVIPILIEDTVLPAEEQLPPGLRPLARCQYLRMHHYDVERDLERVVAELQQLLTLPGATVAHPLGAGEDAETSETEPRYYPFGPGCRIGILPGSILRVRDVDAWVNSENTEMEMPRVTESSVSAIVRYWGSRRDETGRIIEDLVADELARKVGDRRPVGPGTVVVTGAGSLAESHHVRYVLHVASVVGEPGAGFRQVRKVGECVTNVLAEAERLPEVGSVLIPMLGVGVAHADREPTIHTIVRSVVDHLRAHPDSRLHTVDLLAYTSHEFTLLTTAVEAAMPPR